MRETNINIYRGKYKNLEAADDNTLISSYKDKL